MQLSFVTVKLYPLAIDTVPDINDDPVSFILDFLYMLHVIFVRLITIMQVIILKLRDLLHIYPHREYPLFSLNTTPTPTLTLFLLPII